jgi:hypothetical protein
LAGGLTLAVANLTGGCSRNHGGVRLETEALGLSFDGKTGSLTRMENKLTHENLQVRGDDFAVVAQEFSLSPQNMRLASLRKVSEEVVEATYAAEGRQVVSTYKLGASHHFVEKQLAITSPSPYRLKTLVVSKLGLSIPALKMVKYPHLKNITYFGRSAKGGVFLGLELPFDGSSLEGDGTVTLGYQPSLKVKANERLESEPMYLGVYQRRFGETEQADLPSSSESEAMVAMTSAIMGPPRHGLVPMAWVVVRVRAA